MNHASPLPVAVIGAGPVGLAAAAHLIDRGLEQLLEVVAGRGLLEAEHVLEIADTHRLAARGEQAVEDLDPVAVGERLEHALELVGFVIAELRRSEWCAALDHGERRRHAVIVSKKLDLSEELGYGLARIEIFRYVEER